MTISEQDNYLNGFLKGLFWPDQWEKQAKPGGPFSYDDKTRKEKYCWLEGWEHGHRLKLEGKIPAEVIEDPYADILKKK